MNINISTTARMLSLVSSLLAVFIVQQKMVHATQNCQESFALSFHNRQNQKFYQKLTTEKGWLDIFYTQAEKCGIYDRRTCDCTDLQLLKRVLTVYALLPEELVDNLVSTEIQNQNVDTIIEALSISEHPLWTISPTIRAIAPNTADRNLSSVSNQTFLIVGGGFGREIDWIRKYLSKDIPIVAVEHVPNLAKHLRQKYYGVKGVKIVKKDILEYNSRQKFSLALWMWSGILEFNSQEKIKALQTIYDNLQESGTLVIDMLTPHHDQVQTPDRKQSINEKFLKLSVNDAVLNIEFIDDDSLISAAQKVGFSLFYLPIRYKTNGQDRIMFIFVRGPINGANYYSWINSNYDNFKIKKPK